MKIRKILLAFILLGWAVFFCISSAIAGDVPVFASEDGKLILLTNQNSNGLKLFNSDTGEATVITNGLNAGMYASISPGGDYICFKAFKKCAGELLQASMLYSIKDGVIIQLCEFSASAGTPAVSSDGKIAWSVGNVIFVKLTDGKTLTFDIGYYANLLAFSPSGDKISYSNKDEQIVVIKISDGTSSIISDGKKAYWGPEFSPLGDKIAVKSVSGDVAFADLNTKQFTKLGSGENPKWVDNDSIAFVEKKIEKDKVIETNLTVISSKGEIKNKTLLGAGDASAVVGGKNVIVNKDGKMKSGNIGTTGAEFSKDIAVPQGMGGEAILGDVQIESIVNNGTTTQITGVPYIHQVYDTLDTHCGSSSCGATSALMAIQYYNILPANPYTVSSPYVHTSDYGFYISEQYTFNGHTYNIRGRDSCNNWAYGGYGYIIQNNWEDTKTHMAEYISYHGPTSSVDWSPTIAKAQQETYNGYPYVLLNSLTTAGHYITGIGYFNSQNTLVFNDPYGNKNTPGYPSYDGAGSYYDWPGYNNGYQNLNTVHCYIYCRMAAGPTPIPTASPTPSPTPAPGTNVVVDNDQGGSYYTETGTWTTSGTAGYNGTTYRFCYGGDAATATWNGSISTTGTYNVYAMYLQSTNRVTAAKFIVHASTGDQTAYINQNGTQQVVETLIGTFPFNAGTASITLDGAGSTPAASAVIADAVRFTLAAGPTPTPTPPPTPSPTPAITPTPTPTPVPATQSYVYDITMSSRKSGKTYYGRATVWIKDNNGNNVSGATVTGNWTGAVTGTKSGTTGTNGTVLIESAGKTNGGTFTFTVTNVAASGLTYNSSMNIETSGSITAP